MDISNFQTLGGKIDYVECVCCHPEHVLRFLTQETDHGPVLSAYAFMERGGFWQRLWNAVKYVFGVSTEFGHFGEWELHPQDADRLVEILDRIRYKPSGSPALPAPDYVPRRCDINRYTPAEKAIREAMGAVEEMGADVLLTDAVVLLSQAKDRVADFVDRELANKASNAQG